MIEAEAEEAGTKTFAEFQVHMFACRFNIKYLIMAVSTINFVCLASLLAAELREENCGTLISF